ncbi:hypothetical protein AYM40_25235 [Paraburkholderia phytofirmans OLGA172]|uniref:Lipopolysaccharide biosynthesis protein n=1 Tax=Paraburkholderia phytofirmans OLGA172 TaxID=1417228 RepID=A0A160FSP4_9BURK|nr:lipopolysaccharide biosynthesis protein [Paraburkholderia phytofirmans]ANB75648.1 hypothetical protein AYM40_25235 [Paraburkholderia phytofirmans OLGA172]
MTDNLGRKVLSGLLWSTIQSWGGKLATLALFAILARLLDSHSFGVFASAMAVLAFVTIFVDQGLSEAIVQRPSVTPQLLNTAFFVNLVLSVLVFAVLWVTSPFIAKYMKILELTNILRAASVCVLLTALGFSQQAMQRRNFHYRWLAICSVSSTIVSGVCGTILAFSGYGAWSLVIQILINALMNSALLWVRSQWRFSFEFDFAGVRGLFSYGINKLGAQLLDFGNTRYLEIYLAVNLGAAALGCYLVGVKIYQALMQALSGAVLDVAHSGFSRIAHDKDELARVYYKAITLTSAVAVPVFVLLACVAPEVTVIVFGKRWESSAAIMQPMALLGAVQALQFYNGTVYNALGKPSIGLVFLVFKTIVTCLALVLTHGMGLQSVVWWYAFGQIITAPPSFILVQLLVGISLRKIAMRIWPFLVACAVAAGGVWLIRAGEWIVQWTPFFRLLFLSSTGLLIYSTITILFAKNHIEEVMAVFKGRRPATS